jgi:hypothetical protein
MRSGCIPHPLEVVSAFSTETFTFGRECFWPERLVFAAVDLAQGVVITFYAYLYL